MSRHLDLLSHFNTRLSAGPLDFAQKVFKFLYIIVTLFQADVQMLLQMLLKLADISNPLRNWSTSEKWAQSIQQVGYITKLNLMHFAGIFFPR